MLKQYDMELSLQTAKFIPEVWKHVFHKALFSVTHYKKDIVHNKCDAGASSSPAANQASDTHCQGIPFHCSQQTMCILLTFHLEVPHISQTMIWTQHYIDDSSSNEAWKAYFMMDIYLKYLNVQNMTYYSTGWPTKENILDKVRKYAFEVLLTTENKFKIHYQLAGYVTGSMLFHFSLIWWVSVTYSHLQVPGTKYLLYSTLTSECTTM